MALLLFILLWVVAIITTWLWNNGTIKKHKFICVSCIIAVYLAIFSAVPIVKDMEHHDKSQNVSTTKQETKMYPANSHSMVFHKEDCKYVEKISEKNYEVFFDRKEAVQAGYKPCKVCNP